MYGRLTINTPQVQISRATGISEQYLIKLKKGEASTTILTAEKLTAYLNVPITTLFRRVDESNYTAHKPEDDDRQLDKNIIKDLFRTVKDKLAPNPELQYEVLAIFNRMQIEATYEGILIERAGRSDAFMPTLIKYRRGED